MGVGPNVNSGSISGHKEISNAEMDRKVGGSMVDNRDPVAILQNRILKKENIGRASLYSKDDVDLMAASQQKFQLSEEKVRELLDALLAVQRQVEGSATTVTGQAPSEIEFEGAQYSWAEKSTGSAILTSSGKPDVYLAQTGIYFLIFESSGDRAGIKTWADTFCDSLQSNAL